MRKLVESTFVTLDGVISDPQVWGSPYWDEEHGGELDRTLMANRLIDELHLWVFPVLAGSGQPLIDGIETTHLQLVETTPFASGIVVHAYAPK